MYMLGVLSAFFFFIIIATCVAKIGAWDKINVFFLEGRHF